MTTFSKRAPRPRSRHRRPAYPRCLALGVLAVAAACGSNVEFTEGSDTGGAGGNETTSSSSTSGTSTSSTSSGDGGVGGVGGAGATNHVGGGLDGMIGDPYGGGGVGGFAPSGGGDSAS